MQQNNIIAIKNYRNCLPHSMPHQKAVLTRLHNPSLQLNELLLNFLNRLPFVSGEQ